MLYLEDYLEMIENLPMEMRDRLTEMREMDLQVQNALDSLDERVKVFFKKCLLPNVKPEWKEENFDKIKQDYYKSLEDADEKVQLANQIYEMVERHLRKLDQELSKFKMELEADNAGITELLEKRELRSLEVESQQLHSNSHRGEKRRYAQMSLLNHAEKHASTDKVLSTLANEAARETLGLKRGSSSATTSPSLNMFSSRLPAAAAAPTGLTYNLGHVGASSNAVIQAAASQAIAATQQMQQGRRTPSMKASYVAMATHSGLTKDLPFGRVDSLSVGQPASISSDSLPLAAPVRPASALSTSSSSSRSHRNKKQSKAAAAAAAATALLQQQQQQQQQQAQQAQLTLPATTNAASSEESTEAQIVDENGQPVDWQYDPNEPRYCLCNQVSYGDMVGCDNEDCPIEWFHYGCVGLAQAPKGKWYCPQCTAAMKRRGRR